MRPKPTSSSSKQTNNNRNNNEPASPGSPVSSGFTTVSNNSRGKIPWSGIAAGNGATSSNTNSHTPMSFANAAALSMSRSTNQGSRSAIGSPSLTRGTLHRSQLATPGNSASHHENKSSVPFTARSKWDEQKDPEQHQQHDEKRGSSPEGVLYNAGGRNYTVDEMVEIFHDMKRNNAIKNSAEKNDLFHSIVPNAPAVLDPSLQQPFYHDGQSQHDHNAEATFGNANHSNQSSVSNGNSTPFADRLLSAKPSLSDLHKDTGMAQHKSLNLTENALDSPASSSIVLPGVTNSSWSPFGTGTTLAANTESVFKTNGILPKNDLFSGGVGFHTSTPPPGIASPMSAVISPENMNWIYKDPSGVEQGPFNGLRMQEWYSSKWLQDSLLIRRVEESEYYTLKDYMTRINNFIEPFLVPQHMGGRGGYFEDPQQRMQEELLSRQREAVRRQQQLQFASLQLHQQQNSAWGSMSPITTPMSPMSPWAQSQTLPQSQLHSTLGGTPFDFNGLSNSQVNLAQFNNDVWQPRAPGSIPQTPRRVPSVTDLSQADVSAKRNLFNQSEDSTNLNMPSRKDIFDDEEFIPKEAPAVSQSAIQPPSKSPPIETEPVPETQTEPVQPTEEEETKSSKEAKKTEPTAKKSKKTKGKKSVPVSGQQTPSSRAAVPKTDKLAEELTKELELVQIEEETVVVEVSTTETPVDSPKAVAPVLAPWAKKEAAANPKTLSIREIQEMEAAERKTRKAQQQQQQVAAATVALLQASRSGTSTPVSSSMPALPSGATWATVGVSSPSSAPKKSLAQIQKEEEEAARKRASSAGSAPTAARKYTDVTASAPTSYSARTAAAPPVAHSTGGAWTTVGPGGKRVGAGFNSAPTSVPTSTATSPIHRKVEPVRVVAAAPTASAGIKLSSSGEEFLNWCKASLTDLQPGVNQNELLTMLFSLPVSSESKEIIAETIYSSSTTMDGRRFAEEFLKRRRTADNEISGSFTWSDVLTKAAAAPKPVNDGWNVSFKVVGKKKGRRE